MLGYFILRIGCIAWGLRLFFSLMTHALESWNMTFTHTQ